MFSGTFLRSLLEVHRCSDPRHIQFKNLLTSSSYQQNLCMSLHPFGKERTGFVFSNLCSFIFPNVKQSAEDSIHKEVFFSLDGLKSLLTNKKKPCQVNFHLECDSSEVEEEKTIFDMRWGRRIDEICIKINTQRVLRTWR